MSRETKFGLLLVVGLTSVFGFMVYKRLHQPVDLAADTAAENPDGGASSEDVPPLVLPQEDAAAVVTAQGISEKESSPQHGATGVLTVADVQPSPSKPRAPKHPLAENDPFATDSKSATRPVSPGPAAADDPFAEPEPQAVRLSTSRSVPASAAPASDPFAPDVVGTPSGAPTRPPSNAPTLAAQSVRESDPFGSPVPTPKAVPALARPASTPVRTEAPDLGPAATNAEDDPFGAPRSATVAVPTNEATAVSTTVIERRPPVQLELDLSEPAARSATLPAGSTYVVQPEDNYWLISKKVYGTGRYFQALLKHNEQIIADPQRMRPGTEIATPPVADLETRYPALIPELTAPPSTNPIAVVSGDTYITEAGDNFWIISKKVYGSCRYFQALAEHNKTEIPNPMKLKAGTVVQTPPADELQVRYASLLTGSQATVVTASAADPATTDTDVQGFFIGPNDQPQYRVQPEDTLSSIARAHLGRSSRWVQVLEMNRDVLIDGNTLKVGTVLRLPADASQVQTLSFDRADR